MNVDKQETTRFLNETPSDEPNITLHKPLRNDFHEASKEERILPLCHKKIRSFCSKKTLYKRLPVLRWMSNYNRSFFVSDIFAGLTVGLTAIPQGIAYAAVAGLEPQYGLYSGFMGCFVYFILGSVKDITIGPTAIMALMARKTVEDYNSDFAVLLCFLSGCIILLCGVFHFGFLVSFISAPVTLGFTTAAAITILSSQLKGLLGIRGKSNDFLESWISVIKHINETKYEDLSLGLSTIFFLIACKYLNDKIRKNLQNRTNVSKSSKILVEGWRVLTLGRNAVAVVIGTSVAYLFSINGMTPFVLTGKIQGGLPPFRPPPFSTHVTSEKNETIIITFEEMVASLGTGIISVPMVSILETVAIAKAFAKGKKLDATQEMIALGAANIMGSFVLSMPTAGSFTRTAVNNASGVVTPLGGLFTGALVLSALALTSTFKYIPKATLSGVIIAAMFYMIEIREILLVWKVKKVDVIPLTVTILGCLFLGLDYGILTGIVVNLLFILFYAARPQTIKEELLIFNEKILMIRPEQSLLYAGAEYFRDQIMKSLKINPTVVVIEGKHIHNVDVTVAKNMKTLSRDLTESNQKLFFWNWNSSPMETCLNLDYELKKHFKFAETLEELLLPNSENEEP